jgi:spore coat polysaccharide biosynthesis protein SpsF
VTSDCPLIDGLLIRQAVEKYLKLDDHNVYCSNVLERTFPRGMDFEIFSYSLLEQAYKNATQEVDLEHVTPYLNRNRSGNVKFHHVIDDIDNGRLRVTVDTLEDFQLIKNLLETFDAELKGYKDIIEILLDHPELVAINQSIEQKKE